MEPTPTQTPIETVEGASATPVTPNPLSPLFNSFSPQSLLILAACAIAFIAFAIMDGGEVKAGTTKKNKKARSQWAGRKEMRAARSLAIKQLNGRQRKSACAYIVKPKVIQYPESVLKRKKVKRKDGTVVDSTWTPAPEVGSVPKDTPVVVKGEKHRFYSEFEKKTVSSETVWLPDTQRSILVVGGPGSGKTFSAIDPIIRSFIEQGYPILLYDFKYPTQTSCHAWYAKQLGYKIHVFAPGFPESDVVNMLDFLTGDPNVDSAYARQLANVMNANFKVGQSGGGDAFFDSAGDQLVQAVMMLTRQMKLSDVLMTSVILSAPQLLDRLYPESSGIDPWIRQAFGQIFSVKDSEKTVSSIIGTASLNFGKLVMPRILAACMGKTTLPLDVHGKTMIVFGLDRELRDVIAPVVATVMHMMINRNLFRKKGDVMSDGTVWEKNGRADPLCVILDEFPTLCLRQVKNWLNESRSDGFNGVIGIQNMTQMKKTYGDEDSKAILGGCATKFVFNPGEVESAEYFSRLFGEEEIVRKNISKSGGGGKGGTSTSRSIDVGTRKLVAPEEFAMLPPGTCVMTNPAYDNGEMSYLPRRIPFKIPPWEIKLQGMAEDNWEKLREDLIKRAAPFQRMPTQEDVIARTQEFFERFPIPQEGGAPQAMDVLAGMF